jgi:hypothetical protein
MDVVGNLQKRKKKKKKKKESLSERWRGKNETKQSKTQKKIKKQIAL